MSAALAIQKLVFETLIQDTELTTLLAGTHIYDAIPANTKPPYILFGEIGSDDWSTGTEKGEELSIELVVWSAKKGRKQVTQISERIRQSLNDQTGLANGYNLVNFAWENTLTQRARDNRFFTSKLRFRAVVEPLEIS